jgi:hypothetical protein
MSSVKKRIFIQNRIRNLKRKYAKFIQHAEFIDECNEINEEIKNLELELAMM